MDKDNICEFCKCKFSAVTNLIRHKKNNCSKKNNLIKSVKIKKKKLKYTKKKYQKKKLC